MTFKKIVLVVSAVIAVMCTSIIAFANPQFVNSPGTYTVGVDGIAYRMTAGETYSWEVDSGVSVGVYDPSSNYTSLSGTTYTCPDSDGYVLSFGSSDPTASVTFSVYVAPPEPADFGDILDDVGDMATETFTIGSSLVTFATANPIVLVGLGLFILVALIGGIGKLIIL